MKKTILLIGCLTLIVTIKAQNSSICFNGSASSAGPITASGPNITSGDFNGDGIEDLASANTSSNTISVFMGDGLGNFLPAVNYPVGYGPKLIKSNDFNGDGVLDLVYCSGNPSCISIIINSGTGTFLAPTQFTTTPNTIHFVAGDLNHDGKADVVTANSSDTKLKILINNGIGGFFPAIDRILNYTSREITMADLDADGNNDIALIDNSTDNVTTLLGSSTGTFSPTGGANIASFSFYPSSITCNDFNNDGRVDIAVSGDGSGLSSGSFSLAVLLRNTSGTYSNTTFIPIPTQVNCIKSVDVSGDNINDIVCSGTDFKATVLSGTGTGSFAVNNTYFTGALTDNIQTKDFTGDGIIDLAIGNSGYISILRGLGGGNFFTKNFEIEHTTINTVKSIAIADFNGDGINDLAAGNFEQTTVSVFIGTGGGMFAPLVNYTAGTYPTCVKTGDFNGDSNIDLAVTNLSSNDISVLFGSGTGTFSTAVNYTTVGLNPQQLEVEDYNGDGYSDLAAVLSNNNMVIVRFGNAAGTFTATTGVVVGNLPFSISSGDFNGDGKMDLVTGNSNTGNVSVLINSGSSSFLAAVNYSTGLSPRGIVTGDFNGDAKTDIAVANLNAGNVSVLQGVGNGTFLSAVNYSVGSGPFSIIKDDYNNDGKPDLLVAHNNSPFFSILMSTTPGFFSPAINYQIGENQTALSSGDLNGDGTKDIVIQGRVFINSPFVLSLSSSSVICSGNSAVINATAPGISTYSWNTGATTSSISVSPVTTTSYSLTGTSATGCINTAVKTISVSAFSLPTITIASSSNSVCLGSSSILTASGANTYAWNTGAAVSGITVNPSVSSTYTVTGTDINNCYDTQTVSITVDNTCADVWPGDANSDGAADNLDILELGLHYSQTGSARANVSNNWQSYFAINWTGAITNGKNVNHSDCNGDGTIGDDDTLAIYNNYGLTHTFRTAQTTTVNPQLSIVPDQSMVVKGNWGTASVYLGDAVTPINNINGIAFTVDFDNTLIEPNSIYIEYQNSFIDASQNLHFRKLDFASGKIFTATTHTLSNNVNGYGKIATFHYQVLSTLATDQVLNIGLSQANQADASGIIIPLTTGTGTVMAIGASVGVKENAGSEAILVSPNPAHDVLNISFTKLSQNTSIALYNSIGALVLTEKVNDKVQMINTAALSNGLYFIKVLENNKVILMQKIVKQ